MKTIQEKYNGVLEGKFSKQQFVKDAKRELSQFLSPYNGFEDSVQILKGKGILFEAKHEYESSVTPNYSLDALERGIDYELEKAGIDSAGDVSAEDRDKACKKAEKNLEKDAMYYLNLLSGESSKVDKHDGMVPVKKADVIDTHNGMKTAELKEGVSKKLDSIRKYLHKAYTDPKDPNNKAIDDEMIDGFFSVLPPDYEEMDMEEIRKEYEDFLLANYDSVDETSEQTYVNVAKSVDDVIDPHDYVEIGQGYLKGFKRPHSLKDADLETLGRKIVKVLAKGDIEKAKDAFVKEQMTDQEMEDIKNYSSRPADTPSHVFEPGDMFRSDFDYDGMLKYGQKVRINTSLDILEKLYDSFQDVNYHSENSHLGNAIDSIKDGDKAGALKHLNLFRKAVRKTLNDINEGHCNSQRKKNEEVNEYRGAEADIDRIVKDKAMNSGFEEREEAAEVIEYLANKYKLNLKTIQAYMDSPDEPVNPFADPDAPKMNEGRRPKSKGGKVVTENDYETGGYVEAMGPMFDKAVGMLLKAWEEWKKGPQTVSGMVPFAKKDILDYLDSQLSDPTTVLEKKADKDYDGDGKIEDAEKEYLDSRDKAIKKAMKKEEIVKKNLKDIIVKVLEEGVINEAATQELAKLADTYGGFEGMKPALMQLQDIVTDIEAYYDKTRNKIQKVYDTLGDIRNEEGLKVGGFIAPAIENAFNKDLRPAIRSGFTKGLEQPKVKVVSSRDLAAMQGQEELEEKQTVYSRPTVNGALQENSKNKQKK